MEVASMEVDGARYFKTKLFDEVDTKITDALANELERVRRFCFVGAKGVGKSSLLLALWTEYSRKYGSCYHLDLASDVDELREVVKKHKEFPVPEKIPKKPAILFLDNIQEIPSDCKGVVKSRIRGVKVVVCAASRSGLAKMLSSESIRLAVNDFDIIPVICEKSISERILKNQDPDTELKADCLELIGYCPGDTIKLARLFRGQGGLDVGKVRATVWGQLQPGLLDLIAEDKRVISAWNLQNFLKFLALALLGGVSKSDLGTKMRLGLAHLPWTFLTMEGEMIKPVSTLVRDILQEYTTQLEDSSWQTVFAMVESIGFSSGDVRGRVFEGRCVRKSLLEKNSIHYRFSDLERKEILLGNMKSAEVRATEFVNIGMITPMTVIWTPFMRGIDFALMVDKQLYLIQCTVGNVNEKDGFWECGSSDAIYLLVTPLCDYDYIKEFKKMKSHLAKSFLENKFGFIEVDSLVTDEDLAKFR